MRPMPVLPKPAALREVSSRSSASCHSAQTIDDTTAGAMRMSRSTMDGGSLAFSKGN
jgi:hypothetical protein